MKPCQQPLQLPDCWIWFRISSQTGTLHFHAFSKWNMCSRLPAKEFYHVSFPRASRKVHIACELLLTLLTVNRHILLLELLFGNSALSWKSPAAATPIRVTLQPSVWKLDKFAFDCLWWNNTETKASAATPFLRVLESDFATGDLTHCRNPHLPCSTKICSRPRGRPSRRASS